MQIGKTEPRTYVAVHCFEVKPFELVPYLRPGAERRSRSQRKRALGDQGKV